LELLGSFLSFIAHLDQHLVALAQQYGGWIYALLFFIIFAETGLVVTPFLPGDSLLFIAGTVAGAGSLNVHALVVTLIVAAFLGNYVNYRIGRFLGPRIFNRQDSWFFKREYIDRTHAFFEKHGGKTVTISRFLPILRTYAPFVAGIGRMSEVKFALYNLVGAALWTASLVYAGYLIGNLPVIKNNLTLVIVAIIALSLLPGVIAYLRGRRQSA
jgi:membrane-associated protein